MSNGNINKKSATDLQVQTLSFQTAASSATWTTSGPSPQMQHEQKVDALRQSPRIMTAVPPLPPKCGSLATKGWGFTPWAGHVSLTGIGSLILSGSCATFGSTKLASFPRLLWYGPGTIWSGGWRRKSSRTPSSPWRSPAQSGRSSFGSLMSLAEATSRLWHLILGDKFTKQKVERWRPSRVRTVHHYIVSIQIVPGTATTVSPTAKQNTN